MFVWPNILLAAPLILEPKLDNAELTEPGKDDKAPFVTLEILEPKFP